MESECLSTEATALARTLSPQPKKAPAALRAPHRLDFLAVFNGMSRYQTPKPPLYDLYSRVASPTPATTAPGGSLCCPVTGRPMKTVGFTRMEDGTRADYLFLARLKA